MLYSMAHWCCVLLVLCGCVSSGVLVRATNVTCHSWSHYNNASHKCECGKAIQDKISCSERSASIANGFCATKSNHEEGVFYGGYCPFTHRENSMNRIFSEMPGDPDKLEDAMCGSYNRRGLLCRECIDGYGPAVYARDMKCTKCNRGFIILYLVTELVPLTILFLILVIFRLNITSGPLLGYILFCQTFVLSIQGNLDSFNYILDHSSPSRQFMFQLSVALAEVWNLQFFWALIPAYCFSESLTQIDLQMITLVKSTFSILLVIVTYLLMRLYAGNNRVLHVLWKPFDIVREKLRVAPVTNEVPFHALSSLLLLSAPTLAYNLYCLFEKVPVYRSTDGSIHTVVTQLGSSHTHIPYAVIAIVFFIALVCAPSLLLSVYPTRMYKKVMKVLSTKMRLAIAEFVTGLNKCYKDGSEQSWDLRPIAGVVLLFSSLIRPLGDLTSRESLGLQFIMGAAFIFLSFVLSYVRLCRRTVANFSLSYHSMLLGIFSIAGGLWRHDLNTGTDSLELTFIVPPLISHILVIMWAVYLLIQHVAWLFGYHFELTQALASLVRAVKALCHRRRDGYQELIDAP